MKNNFILSTYIPIFLIIFSVAATIPVLSYITFLKSGNQILSTFVISVFGLAYLFSSLPVGVIHHYLKREIKLIGFGIGLMIFSSFLFYTYDTSLFILSRLIIGIAESFVFVGYIGIIVRSFPSLGDATPTLGKFYGVMGLALVFGPSFGSFFIQISDYNLLFIIYSLLQLISLFAILISVKLNLFLKKLDTEEDDKIKIGYKKMSLILIPIIMILVVGSSDGSYQSRAVSWITQIGLNPEFSGYIITVYYISAISSQLFLPEFAKRKGLYKGFLINISISFLSLLTYLFFALIGTPKYFGIFLITSLIGFGIGLLLPYGTEAVTRLFGSSYLIGSGFVNMIWALGYFITPTILAFISPYYLSDLLVIIIVQILILILTIYGLENIKV